MKNLGIMMFLIFTIAIPTTVFAWTDTSIYLAVEDHFSENAYQMLARTNRRAASLNILGTYDVHSSS